MLVVPAGNLAPLIVLKAAAEDDDPVDAYPRAGYQHSYDGDREDELRDRGAGFAG
jgi:hypothetical protein